MTRRPRLASALPIAVLAVSLTGCNLVTPVATSVINSIDPKLAGALLTAAAGQLLPPPKNGNKNLVPIFVKALTGGAPSIEDVTKVLQLCNGADTSKLPETPGRSFVTVNTPSRTSAFGLLANGPFTIKGANEPHRVGLGGASPKKSMKYDLNDASQFDNAPIFEANTGSDGQYTVLAASDTIDLRSQMPPIRNQGARGTCVLFSTAGILDYMYASKSLPIKTSSPQFMDWLYQMEVKSKIPDEKSSLWQDTGTVPESFYPLLHIDGNREVTDDAPYIPPQQGYLSEAECPYNPDLPDATPDADLQTISKTHLGNTLVNKIMAKQSFASQGAYFFAVKSDAASFESALAGGQPIQIGYPIYGSDWDAPSANENFAIAEMSDTKAADEANIGYHSVAIVGYERNAASPGGGYFIIRNSWGPDWGDNGYCRVSYDTTFKYAHAAHVATPYAATFVGAYDLTPPPKDAPPAEQVLAARPLPTAAQEADTGSYTTEDRSSGLGLDQVFTKFLSELLKGLAK
jgi:hypothetical protein